MAGTAGGGGPSDRLMTDETEGDDHAPLSRDELHEATGLHARSPPDRAALRFQGLCSSSPPSWGSIMLVAILTQFRRQSFLLLSALLWLNVLGAGGKTRSRNLLQTRFWSRDGRGATAAHTGAGPPGDSAQGHGGGCFMLVRGG